MRARVTATNAKDKVFTAFTISLGYYLFDNNSNGETYIFTVSQKRYSFINSSRIVNLNEERSNINFVAGK